MVNPWMKSLKTKSMTIYPKCLFLMTWSKLQKVLIRWEDHQNYKLAVSQLKVLMYHWTYSLSKKSREWLLLLIWSEIPSKILFYPLMVKLLWLHPCLMLLIVCSILKFLMSGCMIPLVLKFHGYILWWEHGSLHSKEEMVNFPVGYKMDKDQMISGWQDSLIHKVS